MSRNPILNDKVFGVNGADGRSPSDEWASAQAGGGTGMFARRQSTPPMAPPPMAPPQTGPGGPGAPIGTGQPYGAPYQSEAPASGGPIVTGPGQRTMSLGGVSASALLMFVFIVIGAFYGWSKVSIQRVGIAADGTVVEQGVLDSTGMLIGALLIAFVLAIATVFMPKIARFTAIPYALLEGAVLGMISHLYEVQASGIVLQAILATFAVFIVMLALYGLRILRATPKFVKGVVAATFGVMAMYMIGWVISMFSDSFVPFWQTSGVMGIGISLVIVVIAAMNLILDFDFIERGSKNNLPAYMDWYAAFGLVITLVWLYLEMLRLLSKIRN